MAITDSSFTFGQGVNKDLLPAELPQGMWSDMLNFRPRNGFEEKFEGVITKNTAATITDDVGAFLFPFASPTYGRRAVYGNTQQIYAFSSDGLHYNLTPSNRQAQPINTLTKIAATTAQVVTGLAHGLATGDTISLMGATETGYNTANASVTVIDTTTFQYTTAASISANATVVGNYVVVHSASTQAFKRFLTYATGGSLNGIFFLYSQFDGLYYWAGYTGTALTQVPFVLPRLGGSVVRPFKEYLVFLSITEVYWSNAADPGTLPTTFTAGTGNDAGQVTLAETPGGMVDCLPLGDVNIIYKADSMYAMQYIGGNDVFSFTRIPGEDGLYAAWCVVNTPKGHVFLTQNLDIKIHQGGFATSIADGRVRKWFQSNFDLTSHSDRVFLTVNPEKYEVWVCFATSASIKGCNRALVWNWESDAWGIFDLNAPVGSIANGGVSFANEGLWPTQLTSQSRLLIADNSFHLNLVDSSATSGLTGTLERTGISFGNRDVLKNIERSRWNINASGGQTATISHGAANTAAATPSYATGSTYTVGTTDWLGQRGPMGQFNAVKLTTASDGFAIRSADFDLIVGGQR